MAGLCLARALVAWVPFGRWRGSLGLAASPTIGLGQQAVLAKAVALAAQVDRAADRLPFECKCLPRAVALSWRLRRRSLAHVVVVAVRPPDLRSEPDSLHAWVEIDEIRIIGDLPGPWSVILRLGGRTGAGEASGGKATPIKH